MTSFTCLAPEQFKLNLHLLNQILFYFGAATVTNISIFCLLIPSSNSRVPPAEIEKWKTSFNNLIKNEDCRKAFTSFLQSEYSQENVEFWEACEDFKQTSVDEINVKARKIFERYVEVDSPSEVNLDSATRELTRKNLEKCDASCFEEAQSKIFTLMEKDSYRRFLKSKLFLELSQPPLDHKPCRLEKQGKRHVSDHNQCLPSYA